MAIPEKFKRKGYLVFLVTIVIALVEWIHMQALASKGYPNSDQGEAAYYYNIRGVFLTILCCILILWILISERTGYYRAIFLWCMLIAGLCLCLVGVIRSIVWLSFSDAKKMDEMGNHTRNRFEGGLGLSAHESYVVKEYECCGIKGVMVWRHITDSRKEKPDEHDLDEIAELTSFGVNISEVTKKKEERRTAHVPDECCKKYAYMGCGEANFLKIIDFLEEPLTIMQNIDDAEWKAFENNNYKPVDASYVDFNVSDPRILIPNDELSLASLPGVQVMCADRDVLSKRLFIYHKGRIYNTTKGQLTGGAQGAPCLEEDLSPDCNPGSIKFQFSTVRDFCLYVTHSTMAEEDVAAVIGDDGLLYTEPCGPYMIPYINEITIWTLVYSTILLVLLVFVMIVFHRMYIGTRLTQLKDELPPRWYKPFEMEEGEILGFGDVPHIPDSERLKKPDEPFKEYAKPPVGKYKGPKFTAKDYKEARAAAGRNADQ